MKSSHQTPFASDSPARPSKFARTLQYVRYKAAQRISKIIHILARVDNLMIVFESYNGMSYACSPKAIYEAMLSDDRFRNYTFVWCFMKPEKYQSLLQDPRTRIVQHGSSEYHHVFGRAKYWVVNSMLPLHIAKRKQQVMVQTWHGTPLKRIRGDVIEETQASFDSHDDMVMKNNVDSSRYDYFVVPSNRTKQNFISAFALSKRQQQNILETGYPRNDYLKRYKAADVVAIKRQLDVPVDKKVLLYAPTWRDDQYNPDVGYVYEPPIDFLKLREELGDTYVILFRAHYAIADTYDFSKHAGFVYNVSSVDDVNELYIISDALVTDYSSVLFDYANLNRPMIFYMYDHDHYQKELRGFYFPPTELPGDIVQTQDELTVRLKDLKIYEKSQLPKLKEFHREFNPLDDGHATERVIDAVWGGQRR